MLLVPMIKELVIAESGKLRSDKNSLHHRWRRVSVENYPFFGDNARPLEVRRPTSNSIEKLSVVSFPHRFLGASVSSDRSRP